MPRWDYDVVFYRVFCVTMLAVAFIFTVILTNVFVDVDGLLSNRKKYMQETPTSKGSFITNEESLIEEPKELTFDEDKDYDSEISPSYRTKRSIETHHDIKSPAMKKILTNRLAKLLEELDEDEVKKEKTTTATALVTKMEENRLQGIRNEDLLHLAMHNILLQGLIGHMDLNDVYKKVHIVVQNFNKGFDSNSLQDEKLKILKSIVNSKEVIRSLPNNYNEEHKFFEELIECKKLEDQIAKPSLFNKANVTNTNSNGKDNNIFIKTVIEIDDKDKGSKLPIRTNPNENVEGLVKLIYNGKSIKINQMHDDNAQKTINRKPIPEVNKNKSSELNKDGQMNSGPENTKPNNETRKQKSSPFSNSVLEDYLKKYSLSNYEYLQNSADVETFKTHRLKRQIKVQYSDNNETFSMKPVEAGVKNDDDDLSIEIETHFDGKGTKGEKKKKLVRNLIDKIQRALHSNIERNRDSVEHIKFVKRTQDPIYSQNIVSHVRKKPLEPIEHRQLDPIGKSLLTNENIANRFGETWKKLYNRPNFLSVTKAINSAEMNEVDIDYDNVLRNGILERLQAPLNTQVDDEGIRMLSPQSNNVTLFLKDIDGSGFSIGFNQYQGEPPDVDSMRMFNGIENLIKEYHKTYDQDNNVIINEYPIDKLKDFGAYHEVAKRNVENLHKVYKRSLTELGSSFYKTNIFKIFFKDSPSFHNYLNIYKRCNHQLKLHNRKNNVNKFVFATKNNNINFSSSNSSLEEGHVILHEKVLNKKLKHSGLSSAMNHDNHCRKRRSVNLKKILNLKSKIKLNRYLNTKAITTKKMFMKNNRNKRNVNSIKIIARDKPEKKSDENIFFSSGEFNSYTDKETMIRAHEIGGLKINDHNAELLNDESSFNNIYKIQNPKSQSGPIDSTYNLAVGSNGVMSKYPHLFLDNNSNSKEEMLFGEGQYRKNDKPYRIQALSTRKKIKQDMAGTTEHNFSTVLQDMSVPNFDDFVGAMKSPSKGSNYRITVKMTPKNKTDVHAGFKEFHTSVNKSYDNNGLRYYTLLNVSQISKVEKLNRTDETTEMVQPLRTFIDQQKQIKGLLKLHKQRVDLQVNSLLMESNHLKKMIESNNGYNFDNTINQMTNENSMYSSKEEKLIDFVRTLHGTQNVRSKSVPTTPITYKPIVATPSATETPKISTSEILRKIDTNTELLKTFFQKITEKINFDSIKHTTSNATAKSAIEIKLDLSKDWKSYGVKENPFFDKNELKNDTIPFVYAYQQNIQRRDQSQPQGLASLVYHGHVHTKSVENLNKDNIKKPTPKMIGNVLVNTEDGRRKFNESKYFIDGINNFKIIPSNDHVLSANINMNTTKIK